MVDWARRPQQLQELEKQIQGAQDLLLHFTMARGRSVEFNTTLSNEAAGEEKL